MRILMATIGALLLSISSAASTPFNQWSGDLSIITMRVLGDSSLVVAFDASTGFSCANATQALLDPNDSPNFHDDKLSILLTAMTAGKKVRVIASSCTPSDYPRVTSVMIMN